MARHPGPRPAQVDEFAARDCYEEPDAATFRIRSASYMKSRVKEASSGSLLQLLASQPASLAGLHRFCVRGTHRGDIKLTEAAVAALRLRSEQLDYVGDCYTWDLRTVSCTLDQIRGLL